jgi:hypothetical protein
MCSRYFTSTIFIELIPFCLIEKLRQAIKPSPVLLFQAVGIFFEGLLKYNEKAGNFPSKVNW